MYRFYSFELGWLFTSYSPREIAGFYCFDAFVDETGDSVVVETDSVDFETFEHL